MDFTTFLCNIFYIDCFVLFTYLIIISISCLSAGECQGVIALNMEDGTLHRFHAANTILATGVKHFLSFLAHLSVHEIIRLTWIGVN
jgi:hypothetical protein